MSIIEIEEKLHKMESEALTSIDTAKSADEVEALRLSLLGKKGELTNILQGLSGLDKDTRPLVGKRANEIKVKVQEALDKQKEHVFNLELEQKLAQEKIDITLPGTRLPLGHAHPLSQVTEEIIDIFYGMGFSVADGPEIETDYYNFDALNTPSDHAARDEQDTFYTNISPETLLRSQTSTVQIRVMEKGKPPFRIIAPGRVYRNEEVNARKYPLFHQVEGLLIEKDVTFGQLKGTLNLFIQRFFRSFGKPIETRFRPDFFPFTEPSAELDALCPFCDGKGTNCRTCGQRGWLELLGCGMVDPAVLSAVGIDPEEYSGFAFGMGLERLAMLRYGIKDIRFFYSNHMDFLRQF